MKPLLIDLKQRDSSVEREQQRSVDALLLLSGHIWHAFDASALNGGMLRDSSAAQGRALAVRQRDPFHIKRVLKLWSRFARLDKDHSGRLSLQVPCAL